MKFVLAASLFLIATSANAQSIPSIPTCFPRLAGLAQKLGVGPNDDKNTPAIVVSACNGKTYDLLAMIDALLAKMEKSAKK